MGIPKHIHILPISIIFATHVSIISSQSCSTTFPVASMCVPGTVFGQNVTLDVSTGAEGGYSNCTCSLAANDSGITMIFDTYPSSIDCSSTLNVVFQDKSVQVRCGAPGSPLNTRGTSASIVYTADKDSNSVNSSYCLTFYGDDPGTILSLTCHEPPSTTTTVTSTSAITSTPHATSSSNISATTTVLPQSSNSTDSPSTGTSVSPTASSTLLRNSSTPITITPHATSTNVSNTSTATTVLFASTTASTKSFSNQTTSSSSTATTISSSTSSVGNESGSDTTDSTTTKAHTTSQVSADTNTTSVVTISQTTLANTTVSPSVTPTSQPTGNGTTPLSSTVTNFPNATTTQGLSTTTNNSTFLTTLSANNATTTTTTELSSTQQPTFSGSTTVTPSGQTTITPFSNSSTHDNQTTLQSTTTSKPPTITIGVNITATTPYTDNKTVGSTIVPTTTPTSTATITSAIVDSTIQTTPNVTNSNVTVTTTMLASTTTVPFANASANTTSPESAPPTTTTDATSNSTSTATTIMGTTESQGNITSTSDTGTITSTEAAGNNTTTTVYTNMNTTGSQGTGVTTEIHGNTTTAATSTTEMVGNVTSTTVTSNITTTESSVNITTTMTQENVTLTTTPVNTTTTDVKNRTTTAATITTTDIPGNMTTTETSGNVSTTELFGGNDTTTETLSPDNSTSTGDYNGTTVIDTNSTVANVTTSQPDNVTSPDFYENYDIGNYEPEQNNAVVIIVPLVCVLLLAIIGAFTFIVCKRLHKAKHDARRKSIKDAEKAEMKKDTNLLQTGFLASSVAVKQENKRETDAEHTANRHAGDKYSPVRAGHTENDKDRLISNGDKKKPDRALKAEVHNESFNQTMADTLGADTLGNTREYEPTERERELLNSLELSSIMLESDPNDPNRYFKKLDPVDWYRVIMKKKSPKDPETLKYTSSSLMGTSSSHKSRKHKKYRKDDDENEKRKHRKKKDRLDSVYQEMTSSMNMGDNIKTVLSKPKTDEVDGADTKHAVQQRVIVSKPVPTAETSAKLHDKVANNKQANSSVRQDNTHNSSKSGAIPKATERTSITKPNPSTMSSQSRTKQPIKPIKRPDIVPPLNLTGAYSGGRDDDTYTSVV